ncbi:MAG: dTDP-glucose 4,6-dehydratase [Deltaproteobacteria bacterium]|nr:dTDP-glucose 4,6-dehydratase [Deltaproteobacteria bacterium]
MSARFIVTGGAGFIGANLVHHLLRERDDAHVVVLDKLTYAGNLDNLAAVERSPRYEFVRGDICDRELVRGLFARVRPTVVYNLAAESHVDRSIDGPGDFVRTNVTGTFELLDAARGHFATLAGSERDAFRFLHVSTDEVFGSLGATGYFTEETRYAPNSPYSASKAAADHLSRAWFHTYGLPVLTTNCSNNYGPYQFPEKLIPLVTLNALEGKALPVYGDGSNVRDWLFVGDHCEALAAVAARGVLGETYNVGGNSERTTLEVVHAICDALDEFSPRAGGSSYREQIRFVTDRPGHDKRYAIDASKLARELDWRPRHDFADGLRGTVRWYLDNRSWCERITTGTYARERLGLHQG